MATLLDIKNLEVSYGPIQALKGVDIEVKEGSIVAILGANGAGKTSLLKKISGLIPAVEGQIVFDGQDITKMAPEKITQKGIIQSPEGRQIFKELTVHENLLIGAFTVKSEIINVKLMADDHLPKRIEAMVKEKNRNDFETHVKREEQIKSNLARIYDLFPILKERKNQVSESLSGGEQQMLAIGRALMKTPKLLVLDEPSLGLAPLIVKDIFTILNRLNQAGITVLIVEQNALQTLKIADYAYVLQVGKIQKQGSAKDLIQDEELIEAYLGK